MTTDSQGRQILTGDGTWPFTLVVDGEDLVCEECVATWFGGDSDPQDSGYTACGYPTKGHPRLLGVALPMHGFPHLAETMGSPVPRMPFGLHADGTPNVGGARVRVYCPDTNIALTAPVIDLGPAKAATTRPGEPHAIDLTRALFVALGQDPADGVCRVRYRILGGAKFIGK